MSASDYTLHDWNAIALRSVFNAASAYAGMTAANLHAFGFRALSQEMVASGKMLARAGTTYEKPAFGLPVTRIGEDDIRVTEKIVMHKPYGSLMHFERETDRNDPKVLLVAPMSGHYATLLRGTVEELLPHHDVYVTDWTNVRDVPASHGPFALDDYAAYVEDFLDHLGPDTHVIAVCQPTVPVLAAVSMMAERNSPNQPLSMTLMGGPIDTRAAPTAPTKLAESQSMEWFEQNIVSRVPMGYPGAGQRVLPGFRQLFSFMAMQPERHIHSHRDLFNHYRKGDLESADRISRFYDEYLAVMDIHGAFYLDTVRKVFKEHLLPKGELILSNQKVDPSHIRKTALLTVEGEKDDISAPGQTLAAHKLCNNLAREKQFHYLQPGAGHYGIFEGRRWRSEISPRVADFIRSQGVDKGLKYSEIPSNTRLIPPNFWQKTETKTSPALALEN